MSKIGVVCASRGIMFSKTTESIFTNIKGLDDVELFMAHGRPIPECFNEPLDAALSANCDYIFFVEEDMLLPPDILKRFLSLSVPAVTVDYADRRSGRPMILRDAIGRVVFSPMGCMLVKREVFERMEKPYIRQMVFWKRVEDNGDVFWDPHPEIPVKEYGQQDLYFSWAIRNAGYEITEVVGEKVGHMMLLSRAEDMVNNGGDSVKTVYINDATNTGKN